MQHEALGIYSHVYGCSLGEHFVKVDNVCAKVLLAAFSLCLARVSSGYTYVLGVIIIVCILRVCLVAAPAPLTSRSLLDVKKLREH